MKPDNVRPSPRRDSDRVLIEPTPQTGLVNMERDLELLRQAESANRPATWIRFYRWEAPTVSLGRNQNASDAVDEQFCRRRSIPVVRRPTGGLAVLHADELTYAIASNDASRFPPSIPGSYLAVSQGLRKGFSRLGVDLEIAPGSLKTASRAGVLDEPCFVSVSRHELAHQTRKLVGSAQRRSRRAFLQHGSIPLTIDYAFMAGVFRTDPDRLRSRFVGVCEAAGRPIRFPELAEALLGGLQEATGAPAGCSPFSERK